ncbi:hypothetical protein SDC9_101664 [bioreactor metagenome]|uniref:DUF4145 domain-containing protein n=1 Tax=bioreactor metagenome TaxID=1076179 RepID=A0A645ARC9_9ZZZZ
MKEFSDSIKNLLTNLKNDFQEILLPPEIGLPASGQQVILKGVFVGTRTYLETIAHQANGCYESGWYDACSVMLRRFIETLIIEAFEAYKIDNKIKNSNGDFFYLSDLISSTLAEKTWNLSRNTRRSLPKLKDLGDKSAHSRRFIALRNDLDKLIPDIRVVTQELVLLAKLK